LLRGFLPWAFLLLSLPSRHSDNLPILKNEKPFCPESPPLRKPPSLPFSWNAFCHPPPPFSLLSDSPFFLFPTLIPRDPPFLSAFRKELYPQKGPLFFPLPGGVFSHLPPRHPEEGTFFFFVFWGSVSPLFNCPCQARNITLRELPLFFSSSKIKSVLPFSNRAGA